MCDVMNKVRWGRQEFGSRYMYSGSNAAYNSVRLWQEFGSRYMYSGSNAAYNSVRLWQH